MLIEILWNFQIEANKIWTWRVNITFAFIFVTADLLDKLKCRASIVCELENQIANL